MDHNPYAAPSTTSDVATPRSPGGGPPVPWDIAQVLGDAWAGVRRSFPVLLGTLVVGYAAMFVAQLALTVVMRLLASAGPAGTFVGALVVLAGVLFVQSFIIVGWNRVFVTAARGREPQFGDLFSGADRVATMLGFVGLATVAALVVGGLVSGVLVVGAAGSFAAIVDGFGGGAPAEALRDFGGTLAGLILLGALLSFGALIAFGLAPMFIADTRLGVFACLTASWSTTAGQRLKLGGLFLALWVLNVVGALACLVGLLVTAPMSFLALSIVFVRASGRLGDVVSEFPEPVGRDQEIIR